MQTRLAITGAALAAAVTLIGCSSTGDDSSPDPDDGDTTAGSSPSSEKEPAKDPAKVSRADMGRKWPLTVNKGRLVCIGSRGVGAVVFVAPDGTNYAVNGTAKGRLDHAADINTIWADDKALGMGLKKNIGPLIDRGLKLCR